MLNAIDDHPSVVGSAMRGAVDVVDACQISSARWKEGLSVSKDSGVGRRCYDAVELIVDYDFDVL